MKSYPQIQKEKKEKELQKKEEVIRTINEQIKLLCYHLAKDKWYHNWEVRKTE